MSGEAIKSTVKVCMFDQYGHRGRHAGRLTAIAAPFLRAKGWTGNPNSFVTWWRRTHYENSISMPCFIASTRPYREHRPSRGSHVMDAPASATTGRGPNLVG